MQNSKRERRKHKFSALIRALFIPFLFAAVLSLISAANGKAMIPNRSAFHNFVIYTAIVMLTTMALSINLNSGRFDFSLGAMALFSSLIAAKLTYAVLGGGPGSAVMIFVLSLAAGACLGLISGLIYVLLRIPPIITSLGVTLIYEGAIYTITGGRYVMEEVQNASMAAFSAHAVYALIIIAAVLGLMIYLFNYTVFGFNYRALKEGQKVAVHTGIKEIPNALACYAISGGLMGMVGFMNAARNTNINGGNLNFSSVGIMFTAFLPMFIGSYIGRFINTEIGFFLAALCMSMLNSCFAAFSNQINASAQAIINALLLLLFLIYLSNENLLRNVLQNTAGKRKAADHD